jgi:nucleotidyltransferase/DNA polymerase involved in DNA repair
MPAEQSRYLDAFGELVDVLSDFTPCFTAEDLWQATPKQEMQTARTRSLPARYTLDWEGLPQKEAIPLTKHLGQTVRGETHLHPAIGLATNPFTAQVAATLAQPDHLLPIEADEEADFLAKRSVKFLPLSQETHRRLQQLGMRTLGQLAEMPASTLTDQFGTEATIIRRFLHGEETNAIQAQTNPEIITSTHHFSASVTNSLTLEAVVTRLVAKLAYQLRQQSKAGNHLSLQWLLAEGADETHPLPLRQPTADSHRLTTALHQCLIETPPSAPVDGVTIRMTGLTPHQAEQLTLFGTNDRQIPPFLNPILTKHPDVGFYQAVITQPNHILAERRFQLTSYDTLVAEW